MGAWWFSTVLFLMADLTSLFQDHNQARVMGAFFMPALVLSSQLQQDTFVQNEFMKKVSVFDQQINGSSLQGDQSETRRSIRVGRSEERLRGWEGGEGKNITVFCSSEPQQSAGAVVPENFFQVTTIAQWFNYRKVYVLPRAASASELYLQVVEN